MKPVTFVAVNGKRRLPVAAPPRRDLLTVPVWDPLPTAVQRRCNTAFEFVWGAPGPLDKKAVRQHAVTVGITKDVQIRFRRFRLGLGASMKFVTGLLAAVLLLAGMGASHAVVRIADDRGGRIGTYVDKYQGLRSSGETVIIDGLCASACTIVLGAVPHDRICVTSAANLGFHAAWDFGANGRAVTNTEATQMLYSMYPAPIKRWIAARGGLTPKMIFLRGKALQAIYKPCYLDAQASANRPAAAPSRWEHDPAPQGRASVK
jgi:hypothetical protein